MHRAPSLHRAGAKILNCLPFPEAVENGRMGRLARLGNSRAHIDRTLSNHTLPVRHRRRFRRPPCGGNHGGARRDFRAPIRLPPSVPGRPVLSDRLHRSIRAMRPGAPRALGAQSASGPRTPSPAWPPRGRRAFRAPRPVPLRGVHGQACRPWSAPREQGSSAARHQSSSVVSRSVRGWRISINTTTPTSELRDSR